MDKKRRDSISGQMRKIGTSFKDWRKKSLVGLGFFAKRNQNGRKNNKTGVKKRDEMDDIEILEQIVHEQVDFDWDEFEIQREKSLYLKQNQNQEMASPMTSTSTTPADVIVTKRSSVFVGAVKRPSKKNFLEVSVPKVKENLGVPENELLTGDENDLNENEQEGGVVMDEDDNESLATALIDLSAEDPLQHISGNGKAKLKFITEFAKKGSPEQPRGMQMDTASMIKRSIINSHTQRRSRIKGRERFRGRSHNRSRSIKSESGSRVSRNSNSCPPGGSDAESNYDEGNFEMDLKERMKSLKMNQQQFKAMKKANELSDQFAKYKGYRDSNHMQRHLERLRGFEELRNETQIDLMARENGYKPVRNGRIQSVLSYLDGKDDDFKNAGAESDTDANDEQDDDVSESDGESDDENNSQLCKFMENENDDLDQLAKEWDKVKGLGDNFFGDESSDDEENLLASHESEGMKKTNKSRKKELKERRRKRAINHGWERTRDATPQETYQRRLQPSDSLTMKHLNEIRFG